MVFPTSPFKGGQFGEKVGKKVAEKVGEKAAEKVGESLGEIDKLNLSFALNSYTLTFTSSNTPHTHLHYKLIHAYTRTVSYAS